MRLVGKHAKHTNAWCDDDATVPLHGAAQRGRVGAVAVLCDALGARVNAINDRHETPLALALARARAGADGDVREAAAIAQVGRLRDASEMPRLAPRHSMCCASSVGVGRS